MALREAGFSIKIHLRIKRAGLPIRTEITPGQYSDYTAYDLVRVDNLLQPNILVVGKGYSFEKIRQFIEGRDALPMIPMRKDPKLRKVVDMTIYRLHSARRVLLH